MCSDHEKVLDRQIPRWTVDLTKGMTSPEMDKLETGREKFRRRRLPGDQHVSGFGSVKGSVKGSAPFTRPRVQTRNIIPKTTAG